MKRSWMLLLLAAGGCDALTGVLLMAAPTWTLGLMRIPGVLAEPVYMRWIGAFVFAVGCSYFRPFLHASMQERTRAAHHTLASTAWIRVCIGVFTAAAVVSSALPAAWLTVTATDLTLAAVQIAWTRRGGGSDG